MVVTLVLGFLTACSSILQPEPPQAELSQALKTQSTVLLATACGHRTNIKAQVNDVKDVALRYAGTKRRLIGGNEVDFHQWEGTATLNVTNGWPSEGRDTCDVPVRFTYAGRDDVWGFAEFIADPAK